MLPVFKKTVRLPSSTLLENKRMSRSESPFHLALKSAALRWAQSLGFDVVATEVRIPGSGYRADVIACETTLRGGPQVRRTAVFECKQSRSDLLKDSRSVQRTLDRLRELQSRKHDLDRLLGTHYPSLRTSEELFNEFVVPVDPASLGHEGYQSTLRELEKLQRRLFGKTKFDKLVQWQSADLHYLVVMEGIIEPFESPGGWGLLTWDQTTMHPEFPSVPQLHQVSPPTKCEPGEARRLEMLIGAAKVATREMNRSTT
jgi:hypothetical protein